MQEFRIIYPNGTVSVESYELSDAMVVLCDYVSINWRVGIDAIAQYKKGAQYEFTFCDNYGCGVITAYAETINRHLKG